MSKTDGRDILISISNGLKLGKQEWQQKVEKLSNALMLSFFVFTMASLTPCGSFSIGCFKYIGSTRSIVVVTT
uniref:Uncharacterized protein n=1 Tax=Solanum lycopersicum TaxID=4081 RepID=A0A3Q7F3L6_SOLLC